MSDDLPPDESISALRRRLDDLLDEAAQLRDEASSAARRRADRPFWPDRRCINTPREPDRRSR